MAATSPLGWRASQGHFAEQKANGQFLGFSQASPGISQVITHPPRQPMGIFWSPKACEVRFWGNPRQPIGLLLSKKPMENGRRAAMGILLSRGPMGIFGVRGLLSVETRVAFQAGHSIFSS